MKDYTKDYTKVMMETAYVWANRSHCKRRKVGAVIARDGHILDTGYNGTVKGAKNCCEDEVYTCPECGNQGKDIQDVADVHSALSAEHFGKNRIRAYCKSCNTLIGDAVPEMNEVIKAFNPEYITNEFTVHAGQNIISNCAKKGISVKGATLYVTTSPCKVCAKLIASAEIKNVFYSEEYKDPDGVKFLNDLGIETKQFKVDGSHFYIDPSKQNKDK